MKKQTRTSTLIFLATLGTILIWGCKKLNFLSPKRNITFRGYLMYSCDSPLAGIPIRIDYSSKDYFNRNSENNIGRDTTDINGYFEIVCPNKGDADYYFETNVGFFIFNGQEYRLKYNEDNTVELDKIFPFPPLGNPPDNAGAVHFKFIGNHAGDTFYYGRFGQGVGMGVVYPIPSSYYLSIGASTANEHLPYTKSFSFTWGIGMAEYLKATDSLLRYNGKDSTRFSHLIEMNINYCNPDTTVIIIP